MVAERRLAVRPRGESVSVVTRIPTDDARRLLGECYLFRDLEPEERNVLFGRVRPWWTPATVLVPALAWAAWNWGAVSGYIDRLLQPRTRLTPVKAAPFP